MWKRKHAEQKQIEKNEKSSREIKRKLSMYLKEFISPIRRKGIEDYKPSSLRCFISSHFVIVHLLSIVLHRFYRQGNLYGLHLLQSIYKILLESV